MGGISKGQVAVAATTGAAAYAFADDIMDMTGLQGEARAGTAIAVGAGMVAGGMWMCAKDGAAARYGGAALVGGGAGLALRGVNDYFGFAE